MNTYPTSSLPFTPPSIPAAHPETIEIPAQEIAERAFALWEQSGHIHGADHEHWLRAERELRYDRAFAASLHGSVPDSFVRDSMRQKNNMRRPSFSVPADDVNDHTHRSAA